MVSLMTRLALLPGIYLYYGVFCLPVSITCDVSAAFPLPTTPLSIVVKISKLALFSIRGNRSRSRHLPTSFAKLSLPTRPAMAVTIAPLDAESVTLAQPTTKLEGTVTVHLSPPRPDANGDDLLVVSPYDELPHLLDLRTLDTANQLLARALVGLRCLRADYATAPYIETFNWSEVVQSVQELASASNFTWKEQGFYIVVFRSQIPPTTACADLGVLDKAAHAEATESGGFLKYWFGSPDKHGRNLATCVWRNQHDARIGSVGEAHRRAASAARLLYTEWRIERLKLLIKEDAKDFEII